MEESRVIEFHHVRNFSDKMNAIYSFLRQNYKVLGKALLYIAGPPVLLSGILFFDIFMNLVDADNGVAAPGPFAAVSRIGEWNVVLQVLGMMLFMLVAGVITISTTYAYMMLYQEKAPATIEVIEVWRRVKRIFWRHLLSMVLYCFFGILVAVILIIPLGLFMVLLAAVSPYLFVVIYLAYYAFVFLVMNNFAMLFFIQQYEGGGYFNAIGRVFFLMKNNWWSTALIGGINMYVQYVFAIILMIPAYVVLFMAEMHKVDSTYEGPSLLIRSITAASLVLYFLAGTILFALPLIALAFQYFNLLERRQGKGLMMRIQDFGLKKETLDDYADY